MVKSNSLEGGPHYNGSIAEANTYKYSYQTYFSRNNWDGNIISNNFSPQTESGYCIDLYSDYIKQVTIKNNKENLTITHSLIYHEQNFN